MSRMNELQQRKKWWKQLLFGYSAATWKYTHSAGGLKMADAFGRALHGRGEKSFRHYGPDLNFPEAVQGALNPPLCISVCASLCLFVSCQGRRVRRWSWKMWSSISVSVCHASRTTAPFLSSLLTARASSCPTVSTPQWEGHWLFFYNSLFVSQWYMIKCCHNLEFSFYHLSVNIFCAQEQIL